MRNGARHDKHDQRRCNGRQPRRAAPGRWLSREAVAIQRAGPASEPAGQSARLRAEHCPGDPFPERVGRDREGYAAEQLSTEYKIPEIPGTAVAGVDVAGKPPAQPGGQRGRCLIPLPDEGAGDRAAGPAGPEDGNGGGRTLELTAGTRQQSTRVPFGDAQDGSQVRAVKAMPEREIEHLTIVIGQPVKGSDHDQQGLPGPILGLDVADLEFPGHGVRGGDPLLKGIGPVRGKVASIRHPRATGQLTKAGQLHEALTASDGVEPHAQPIRITQLANIRRRDDEGVLQHGCSCNRVPENFLTVIVQIRCEFVEQTRDNRLADVFRRLGSRLISG